jgi:hypothetical protein
MLLPLKILTEMFFRIFRNSAYSLGRIFGMLIKVKKPASNGGKH